MPLAARLAAENQANGWRQHEHLLENVRKLVREIGRSSRAKEGSERLKLGYQKLLKLADDLLVRARRLHLERVAAEASTWVPRTLDEAKSGHVPTTRVGLLEHYLLLT